MINFFRRVFQARSDVVRFQIRKILKNFRLRNAGGEHFQHVLHADAQASDARAPPALPGVKCNAMDVFHNPNFNTLYSFSQKTARLLAIADNGLDARGTYAS